MVAVAELDVQQAGLLSRLEAGLAALSSVIADLDPACLAGPDALRVYESLSSYVRMGEAGKTLLAPRIDESGIWKEGGYRSPAVMLAELEGISPGQAQTTLSNGVRLTQLPGTEQALRAGELSGPKLTELTTAGVLCPGSERDLLDGAGEAPLKVIRDRCQRSRATGADQVARIKRIRAERSFSSWIDPEGAFCFKGRDTPDRGAEVLSRLEQIASRLREEQRADAKADRDADRIPERIPERAIRADAFFALMTQPPGDGSPPVDGAPRTQVVVRVDLAALLRGHLESGECCEIDDLGPIPVPMARDLANDSFLAVLFHRAGDIKAVSHFGRTINATLRTALAQRDRICVVPGCGVSYGLEIDHVLPFAEGGPTSLDNLALLCHHHHFLKTYDGWRLQRRGTTDEEPKWSFAPQPPFGQEPDLGLDLPGQRMELGP
jgi:Domain of unknown function (DUF222)/HNH endonuclease